MNTEMSYLELKNIINEAQEASSEMFVPLFLHIYPLAVKDFADGGATMGSINLDSRNKKSDGVNCLESLIIEFKSKADSPTSLTVVYKAVRLSSPDDPSNKYELTKVESK